MSPNQDTLRAWRLRSQKLGNQRYQSPEEVVEWLGGVQAQNYTWAKWAIGLRTEACSEVMVEEAIQNHQIVRTWMFRGTLHFLAASDLSWLTTLLAPGIIKGNARRYRELELEEVDFQRGQNVLRRALENNRSLTRPQIKKLFEERGVPAVGQQVPYILQRASLDGLICQGPLYGKDPTFVLVSDWIGTRSPMEPAEALRSLAVQYFSSHGPATEHDLALWAGLTVKEAHLARDAASELAPIEVDGIRYWAGDDHPPVEETDRGTLLPPFDEFLLGYKERSLALNPLHAKQVNPGGGMLKPTVILNGEVLGIWNYKMKKPGMVVYVQAFQNLDSVQRQLIQTAASQLSDFKSMPVEVTYDSSYVN